MKDNIKNRLRNRGLWVAIAALFYLTLKHFGVVVQEEAYWQYIDALLLVAVLLGVVNNPATENKGFGDDK